MMKTSLLETQVTTFSPQGYLSAANAGKFLQELTQLVQSPATSPLLIDMKEVDFMDSAGLMALIEAFRLAQELEKELSICSVAPSVRMIFELTQLDRVFDIFDSKDSFISKTVK